MNKTNTLKICVLLVVGLFCSCSLASACCAGPRGPKHKTATVAGKIGASIGPQNKSWVKKQLTQGHSVLLTNSYLFQVMKGAAQENQKRAEEQVLIPLLKQVLNGLVAATDHADSRRLFGVALFLLSDDTNVELDEVGKRQADMVKQDPMFAPRGHYTDSEALEKYFRAMQYLAKTTVDVSVRPDLFPYPKEMLIPFETAESVRQVFLDPANEPLVRAWKLIHSFYSGVNGTPDYPTFVDLVKIAEGKNITPQDVKEWARVQGVPKINPERGLGIQPFGERTSIHEEVIDQIKRQFIRDDAPREEIAEVLRFENLLKGVRGEQASVRGLAERVPGEAQSYYESVLKAVALGADGWQRTPMRLNFFAASLTSLAEQTALMTKTSIVVRKSADLSKKVPEDLRLYFEADSHKYLTALADASASIVNACRRIADESDIQSKEGLKLIELGAMFRKLANLARSRRYLATQGPLWETHGDDLMALVRKPSVAVDVFHVKDRNGKVAYYQWAVAPFEIEHSAMKSTRKTSGLEMVFFEGWADEMVTGHQGPLSNLVWENRVLEGGLGVLPSIVKVPK